MTRPVLAPPTPGLSLQRLEIALLCVHVLQKHQVEIEGLGARELLAWAGVPEEHLSPEDGEWRRTVTFPNLSGSTWNHVAAIVAARERNPWATTAPATAGDATRQG